MKKSIRHTGFTLIELTLYMGLVGIFLLFMSNVFVSIMSAKLETESKAPLYEDANYIISRLTYDIHRASRIIAPLAGQSGSVVTLGIMEGGGEHTYQYALNNTILTLFDGSSIDRLHGSSIEVNQFIATRIGNSLSIPRAKDTLQIQLTVSSSIQRASGPKTITIQSTIGMR